jgi:negative regulator of flagellin synthesis FlgM
MKIRQLEKPPLPATGERSTAAARPEAAPQEASAQVELSATALLASEGDFDAEKVSRIAQAISEGKFTVNAEVIADKLIANAGELLGRASH